MLIDDCESWNDKHLGLLGGKGRNLALLTKNRLPVPRWFCLPASLFRDHIHPVESEIRSLLKKVDRADPRSIIKTSRKLRSLITAQVLNHDVLAAISSRLTSTNAAKFYSVRSSAVQEDSAQHSFAGLFDTYLYVASQLVHGKILDCWASLYSERAVSYFLNNGFAPLDMEMAVIVQEMIDSAKSGVMFQADPVGKLEEIMVVAGYGLGEGVVSNEVEVDTYRYNRIAKNISSDVVEKRYQLIYNATEGSGLSKREVPEDLRRQAVLSNDEMRKLISLNQAVERVYDDYQDIEWGMTDAGDLYLLQSRPITTIPGGQMHLYDNSNISENYPGVSSPLTCTVVKRFYAENFVTTYRKLGYSKYMGKLRACFEDMIGIIQGRIYYNMTNWYRMLSLLPGKSSSLYSYFEEMIGAVNTKTDDRIAVSGWTRIKALFIISWAFINWERIFRSYQKKFKSIYAAHTKALSSARYPELKDLYEKAVHDYWSLGDVTIRNDYYVMLLTGRLRRIIKELTDEQNAEKIFNSLLIGDQEIESVEPVISIMHMAKQVQASLKLRNALVDKALLGNRATPDEFASFRADFMTHLEKYGDRGVLELKLESRTYRQNPQDLIDLIVSFADSTIDRTEMKRQKSELHCEAEKEFAKLLKKKLPLTRLFIAYLLHKARLFVKNREAGRFNRTRAYGFVRSIVLRIAEEWVTRGVLLSADDIYYLTDEEIVKYIDAPAAEEIRRLIEERKHEWNDYREREPEDRLYLKGEIGKNYIPQKPAGGNVVQDGKELRGLGCCPGVVKGRAIIVKSADARDIEKDRILVAANTDPGWIFWIMASKGLIVEKGNFLSHTAIIGRELGKPTIVCVANATERIRENALVSMDGTRGTIDILSEE